ncbi:MAG TPA: serine/threonine-protein kinase [Ktedonobacteraceae bacterium]|nr:serine/threonine-protein kinase [Ktedonobacteraceae bacterium]
MALSPIYCSDCGALVNPGSKFCAKCGHVMQAFTLLPSLPLNPTGLLPGESLLNKRYRISMLAGSGGMGAVYKAQDTLNGDRYVAVKEMRQSRLTQEELDRASERFRDEALMLAHLQHPGLPRIYDHFVEMNRWYLVMDFIEGETLSERLQKAPGNKLSPQEVVDISIQLCEVLDYLHTHQPPIIFRDLKPSNVMLTSAEHLYLIDFGIARLFKPGQAKDTNAYGSVGYSAPEQFGVEQTTPQADIYSLGATMYEMLAGSSPALTPFQLPPLSFPGQAALTRLATLIAQMLDMNKEHRPQSMAATRRELESIKDELKQLPPATIAPAQYASWPAAAPLAPTQYAPPPAPKAHSSPAIAGGGQQEQQRAAPQFTTKGKVRTIGKRQVIAMAVGALISTIIGLLLHLLVNVEAASINAPILSAIFPGMGVASPHWFEMVISLGFFIAFYFGAAYGPWVGLVVAVVGALLSDAISHSLSSWYWYVAIAALGFIAGLVFLRTRGYYKNVSSILLAVACSAAGVFFLVIIVLLGNYISSSAGFGMFLPTLLADTLVHLDGLVPFIILLVIASAITTARSSRQT